MKIQSLNTGFNIYHQNRNNTAVNFTSFAYKPGAKLSIRNFNPLKLHMNKFFERSLLISRLRFQELSPELTPYTHEVSVGKSYAWDINKDNRKKVKTEKRPKERKKSFLDIYGTNLTNKAKNHELDMVIKNRSNSLVL